MNRRLAAAGLAALLSGCTATAASPHFRGSPLTAAPAPDFTLTSDVGTPWTLSAQHGKVVALFFGYTHCDDTCPDTLAKLAASLRAAGATPSDGEVAFVTVDPQRDTPSVMQSYIKRFSGGKIVGLTGSPAQIASVERAYHMYAQRVATHKDGATSYDEAHSSFTFLIDRRGEQRVIHDDSDSRASFTADLRTLLQ
jgi:protein SCO1/2